MEAQHADSSAATIPKASVKISSQPLRSYHYQCVLKENHKPTSSRQAPPKPPSRYRTVVHAAPNVLPRQVSPVGRGRQIRPLLAAREGRRQRTSAEQRHSRSRGDDRTTPVAQPPVQSNCAKQSSTRRRSPSLLAVPHLGARSACVYTNGAAASTPRTPHSTRRRTGGSPRSEVVVSTGATCSASNSVTPRMGTPLRSARHREASVPSTLAYGTLLLDRDALKRPASVSPHAASHTLAAPPPVITDSAAVQEAATA